MEQTEPIEITLLAILSVMGYELHSDEFDTALSNFGMDSMDHLTLVMNVEKRFKISILDREAELLWTYNNWLETIRTKTAAK